MQLHPEGARPGSSFPSSSWMILVSRGSGGTSGQSTQRFLSLRGMFSSSSCGSRE